MVLDERTGGFPGRIILVPSILDPPLLPLLIERSSLVFEKIHAARERADNATISELIGAEERFVPTASSVSLRAALSDEDVHSLLATICKSPAKKWIERALSGGAVCDLNQSWVRRQYAPANYPPHHAPHGWHQDGALGFDFLSHSGGNYPGDALLRMATCWIPLDPCGVEAPGLELMTERLPQLLPPAELSHARICKRFPGDHFWRPAMQPGNALLFCGDTLHRTHVTPAMTCDRSSIELRFFPASGFPARLKQSRLVPLGH
jgi:hypothetical protein